MIIGLGEDLTSSITDFRRFSNSPFIPAPACSKPRSSDRTRHSSAVRNIAFGDPKSEALDDGCFTDASFAGKDRVILAAPSKDVDDLSNFEITSKYRIDLTRSAFAVKSSVY